MGEEAFVNDSQKSDTGNVERLVEASRSGDRRAFDELVRLYQQQAMYAASRILGNVSEAAEATQQGFLKAYLKIDKLKEPKRFGTWLLRIVCNAAISQRRAMKDKGSIAITDCYEDKKNSSPIEREISEELKQVIQKAMLKLSKKETKAISLFGLEDLSQSEAAEIMGCSVEAVRWHVFQARKKLKVLLKEYLK